MQETVNWSSELTLSREKVVMSEEYSIADSKQTDFGFGVDAQTEDPLRPDSLPIRPLRMTLSWVGSPVLAPGRRCVSLSVVSQRGRKWNLWEGALRQRFHSQSHGDAGHENFLRHSIGHVCTAAVTMWPQLEKGHLVKDTFC